MFVVIVSICVRTAIFHLGIMQYMVDVQHLVYRTIQDVLRFDRDIDTASAWSAGSWIEKLDNKEVTQVDFLKWALQPKGYYSVGGLDDLSKLVVFQVVPCVHFLNR